MRFAALILLLTGTVWAIGSFADSFKSQEQITKDLIPSNAPADEVIRTRAIGVVEVNDEQRAPAETLSGSSPAAVTSGSASSGRTNLEVNFEFNSDKLTFKAMQQLNELGKSLNSEQLKSYQFDLVGHTDASGSAVYNQQLSEKRALSVKSYLAGMHGVSADRLQAIGRGEEQLLIPANPTAAANRRVEVITR